MSMRGAFVLHLHYEDEALDLVRRVGRIDNGFEVWATGQAAATAAIRKALGGLRRPVTVIDTPNAGRDIGAFCFILPILADCGFELVAKLHTKGGGSGYGAEWRDHMLDRLATPDAARAIKAAFLADPNLGMVGADRLLKPVSGHMFRNRSILSALTAQLWPGAATPEDWSFFAGSMMWMRTEVLAPLIQESERLMFAAEAGDHDGRLEHAVERALGLTPLMAGRGVAVLAREDGPPDVRLAAPDPEPLIETLARFRQSRLDAVNKRPISPGEIALSLRRNPLIDYLDGGAHDPNRLTHEGWRRDRRGAVVPSLADWPKGPPASPITDGRGRGEASLAAMLHGGDAVTTARWRRRRVEAASDAAARYAIGVVVAPGAEDRGELIAGSLRRLGHEATSGESFEAQTDFNLVVGGHKDLKPPAGPANILLPLERAPRAAYAEYDRYDAALVDPGLADLWGGIVRPPVGRLPRAEGDGEADIDRWTAAVLDEALAQLDGRPPAGASVRIVARSGAGGWPRSSAYLRLLGPLSFRADEGAPRPRFADPDEPLEDEAVVVVQRDAFADLTHAEAFIARLRRARGRLVFDIDDALHLIGPDHPDHADFAPRLRAMACIAAEADEIWTATEPLAQHYRQFGRPVSVRRNRLDPRLWREALARPPMTPRTSGPLQLLYMGTTSHDADLAPVIEALDELEGQEPGRFALTLIGGQRQPPSRAWLRVLSPPKTQRAYPRFVRWLSRQRAEDGGDFEIGLAPLADTPFNAGKSDLKILDYAALGLAPMISVVPAFAGHAGRRVLTVADGEWRQALESAQRNRAGLGLAASQAREWLSSKRLGADHG